MAHRLQQLDTGGEICHPCFASIATKRPSRTMRFCHHCRTDIGDTLSVGRRDACLRCGADLHCCLNCQHHDPGYHNQCRETEAEWQVDKQAGNFCDYFSFRSGGLAEKKKDDARSRLEALFRKEKS